jgi:hypothetical protein
MARLAVAPGTITVFTDVMCGWSTVALYRPGPTLSGWYRTRIPAPMSCRRACTGHEFDLARRVCVCCRDRPLG